MIHPMIQFQQQNLTQTSINNVKNIMCLWDFELSTKSLTAEKKSAKLRTQFTLKSISAGRLWKGVAKTRNGNRNGMENGKYNITFIA